MTRRERELRELELTLYCTGRYGSRREARAAAVAQLRREREKREKAEAEKIGVTVVGDLSGYGSH